MENPGFIEANQFCTVHNIEISFIQSLNEYGLIEIREDETSIWIPEQQVSPLEKYIRFHYDMDMNIEGIHAVAHLLDTISRMEDEIVQLRRKLALYE
jgi:hypothetical protein